MSSRLRTYAIGLLAAAGGLVVVPAIGPTAAEAAPSPPVTGGFTATSSWQCTSVDGVRACAQVNYDPRTHQVRAHSWATDEPGGPNWTVNAGVTRLWVGANVEPRRTVTPSPSGLRIMVPIVVRTVNAPDTAAGRDDDYTTWASADPAYYRTRTVVHATAGKQKIQISVNSGPWTRFE